MQAEECSGDHQIDHVLTTAAPAARRSAPADLLDISLIVGLCLSIAVSVWLLADSHFQMKRSAEKDALNVVEAVSSRIEQDLVTLSLSVDGTVRASQLPGIWDLSSPIRQAALFDTSLGVKNLSSLLVIDKDGALRATSGNDVLPAVAVNDRPYFQYHRDHPDTAIHVSGPVVSRLSGQRLIILSMRINDSRGNFAGIVAGGLLISAYQDLFRQLDLRAKDTISLAFTNGGLVAREPVDPRTDSISFAQAPLFRLAQSTPTGTFAASSLIDGRKRIVAYHTLTGFPLIIAYGRDTADVFGAWYRMAFWVSAGLLVLGALEIFVIWMLRRERARRIEAELSAIISARDLAALNKNLEHRIQGEIQSRQETQEKLAASQRNEALGHLAGGIAHDVNNVLQTISGACDILQRRCADNGAIQRLLETALGAADRGSAITRRLLVFARKAPIKTENVDVIAVLTDLQELLNHTLCGNVVIRLDLAAELPNVAVDRMQLETVIINLATNARDAMPDGGTVTITAWVDTIESTKNTEDADLVEFVRLSIADTGVGMDSDTLARATEPFFSTKQAGAGTGLGLSMAKGFAEQSRGRFAINSCVGSGTSVTLWLPVAKTDVTALLASSDKASARRKGYNVLIVDDDDRPRALIAEGLAGLDFVVQQAASGKAALERLGSGQKFDLMLTDLSMPDMDGVELIRQARLRVPGLPAIILTGNYGAVASLALEDAIGGECLLLHKPIRIDELADHIGLVLRGTLIASSALP